MKPRDKRADYNEFLESKRFRFAAHGKDVRDSDIETKVLQHGYNHGRDHDDEKHICPLQLETIERCIKLYSNPGETVLSPFGGIGSEGYVALQNGRKAIIIELKESYFNEAIKNLRTAAAKGNAPDLFEFTGVEVNDMATVAE